MTKKTYIKTDNNIFEVFYDEHGERYFISGKEKSRLYEDYWKYEPVRKESDDILDLADKVIFFNKKTGKDFTSNPYRLIIDQMSSNPNYEGYLYIWSSKTKDLLKIAKIEPDKKIILLDR